MFNVRANHLLLQHRPHFLNAYKVHAVAGEHGLGRYTAWQSFKLETSLHAGGFVHKSYRQLPFTAPIFLHPAAEHLRCMQECFHVHSLAKSHQAVSEPFAQTTFLHRKE